METQKKDKMALAPRRNLILFVGKSIPIIICNNHITKVYNHLVELVPELFRNDTTFEIRANFYNYSLIITGDVSDYMSKKIISASYSFLPLVYFEIKSPFTKSHQILVNSKYQCKYNIYYNPISFRQPDDVIRDIMEKFIIKFCNGFNNFCFLGGECVLFSKILNYNNAQFYTDMPSIFEDINYNVKLNDKNIKASLIDYNTYDIAFELNEFFRDLPYTVIINTSKSGMGENLSQQLAKTLAKRIIIISCNRKSFIKDCIFLHKGGYKMKDQQVAMTNYEVLFTVLE